MVAPAMVAVALLLLPWVGAGTLMEAEKEQRRYLRTVPGWGGPTWGGRSFSDSIANINPWTKTRSAPVVQDLEPTAPFDRVNKEEGSWASTILGAAPKAPTDEFDSLGYAPVLRSDNVSPDLQVHTFPADQERPDERTSSIIPMQDRELVASADKLRPAYAWRGSGNYPLVAPADRTISSKQKIYGWMGGPDESERWPVGSTDRVGDKFSKFFDQLHNREQRRQEANALEKAYNAADVDKDGTISREEYDKMLMEGQNKTQEEAEQLWSRYHLSEDRGITRSEYKHLAQDGFDLGAISRKDISSVISLPGAPHTGFWGSGAKCPEGSYVSGAKLKVMSLDEKGDDSALNALSFRCTDGTEVRTAEGPAGAWTAWALCPQGQHVFSVRARSHPFRKGQDNVALATVELGCRRPDLMEISRLKFAAEAPAVSRENEIVGIGPAAAGGGWTKEYMCGSKDAICGAQAHIIRDQGQADDMGVADLRFYCCASPVDCTEACGPPRGPDAVKCQVCQIAAGLRKSSVGLANGGAVQHRERSPNEDFRSGRRRRSVLMPPLPSEFVPLPSEIIPLGG